MKKASQEKIKLWKQRIGECAASKKSMRLWCQENGCALSTFQYWKRKLFGTNKRLNGNIDHGPFAELADLETSHAGVIFHVGKLHIEICADFDQVTLKRCLHVLKEMSC